MTKLIFLKVILRIFFLISYNQSKKKKEIICLKVGKKSSVDDEKIKFQK